MKIICRWCAGFYKNRMDQVKYSLKTKQFIKRKRQIFEKKDSVASLIIHEPDTGNEFDFTQTRQLGGHLHQRDRTNSSASSFNYHNHIYDHWLRGQSSMGSTHQFVSIEGQMSSRVQKSPERKVSQLSNFRPITETKEQKEEESGKIERRHERKNSECSSQSMAELIWVRVLLLQNQERIHILSDSLNRISHDTASLYEEHSKNLRQIVAKRCEQMTDIFRKIVHFFKVKSEMTDELDQRVTLFYNTLKQTRQNLRMLSIKQECIELQLKDNQKNEGSNILNKIINQRQKDFGKETNFDSLGTFEYFSEGKIGSQHKIENPFVDQSPIAKWKVSNTNSLLPIENSEQQFGDFEQRTNIKSPLHEFISNFPPAQISLSSHRQYTFHGSHNIDSRSSKYEYLVKKINQAAGKRPRLWLDNLECLRTEIGGYLLDDAGNAIICSPASFSQLLKQGMILNATAQ